MVGIQIVSAYFLLRGIGVENRPNYLNKISLTTIALCNIEDFYMMMTHIQYIMQTNVQIFIR